MTDFPSPLGAAYLSTHHPGSGSIGELVVGSHLGNSSTVWPGANRAIYLPFEVNRICTVYQIAFEVTVQAGNLDVGIYDAAGNRVVSKGSTAVGVAGVQVVDITDTVLKPNAYFLAMCCDDATTAAFRQCTCGTNVDVLRTAGVQQQAVGAVTLPDPAVFANPASNYIPLMYVSTLQATI